MVLNIILNIYVLSIIFAGMSVAVFAYKISTILGRLDIFKILQNSKSDVKSTIMMIIFIFCPLLNIAVTLLCLYLIYLNDEEAAAFINDSLECKKKKKEDDMDEKNDNQQNNE